jgi:hypothetical protein
MAAAFCKDSKTIAIADISRFNELADFMPDRENLKGQAGNPILHGYDSLRF